MSSSASSQTLLAPDILLNDIVSIKVSFIDFDGNAQQGTVEVHKSIQEDITALFEYMYELRFPLTSVVPISHFNGSDDDSMEVNNSYAFGFRTVTLDPTRVSLHGYGMAIDLNPALNPYIKEGRTLPPHATYVPGNPGVLDANHPVVVFMKARGYTWGGDWEKSYYDYQHFQRELPEEYHKKYEAEIKQVLIKGGTMYS